MGKYKLDYFSKYYFYEEEDFLKNVEDGEYILEQIKKSNRFDYKDFNEWFKRNDNRKVYLTFNEGKITSFLMLKEETNEEYDFSCEFNRGNILKICTMKVVTNGIGIGEEFIKIIFNKAEEICAVFTL